MLYCSIFMCYYNIYFLYYKQLRETFYVFRWFNVVNLSSVLHRMNNINELVYKANLVCIKLALFTIFYKDARSTNHKNHKI